jgi:tetratricopeptide (TPR) repeat protein
MGIGQLMTMPLFFASNAIYPLILMPNWLKYVATLNPLTYLVDALRGLAALAVDGQNFERALDYQARLIDKGERSPELFYNTGLLLHKSGQLDDAERLYKEALQERPTFPEALLNLGHVLKSQGKQDEARDCWKQALEQKPELAQGYFAQPS